MSIDDIIAATELMKKLTNHIEIVNRAIEENRKKIEPLMARLDAVIEEMKRFEGPKA